QRQSVGRCDAPTFACGSTQRLAAQLSRKRISARGYCQRLQQKNPAAMVPTAQTGGVVSDFVGKCSFHVKGLKWSSNCEGTTLARISRASSLLFEQRGNRQQAIIAFPIDAGLHNLRTDALLEAPGNANIPSGQSRGGMRRKTKGLARILARRGVQRGRLSIARRPGRPATAAHRG